MSSARDPADLEPEQLAAHDRFVRAVIRRFVADPEQVEDLTQETWLAALQHSAAARLLGRAWLGTVAQNFVFQALRGRARRLAREARVARSEVVVPEENALDPELRRRMLEAVRELQEPYRSAIHLRFFEDLMPAEIAERIGTRPETVRTRIKRGLAQIHRRLRASASPAAPVPPHPEEAIPPEPAPRAHPLLAWLLLVPQTDGARTALIEPRTVAWEEMAREVFDPRWIVPSGLALAEDETGLAWELERELPRRVGLVVDPSAADTLAPRCFGDLAALARGRDPETIEALLERVRAAQPELWRELGPFAKELLRDEALRGAKWKPEKDSGNDGMLLARPLTLAGTTSEPWSTLAGSRLVQQAAALVHADLEAIKQAECDLARYPSRPGTHYLTIRAVEQSHVRGVDARERPFAALKFAFECDLPFPFTTYACELRLLNRVRDDGRLVCDVVSTSPDLHWMAGRDLFVPVRASDGAWQGTLVVRLFGLDLCGVPDGDVERRAGLRANLGSLKREAEERYRAYAGPPRTLDGTVPPFDVPRGR